MASRPFFCVYCDGLVTGDGGYEEIEDEAHAECAARKRRAGPQC